MSVLQRQTRQIPEWLWGLFVLAVALRLALGANFLNLFYNYTSGSGSPLIKIHPSTYLLLLSLVLAAVTRPDLFGFVSRYTKSTLAILLFGALYALYFNRPNMTAVIVDSLVFSIIVGEVVFGLSPGRRRFLCTLIVYAIAVHLIVVVAEFAQKGAIVPRLRDDELFFRPQGFLDHPLTAGYLALTCMAWVASSQWSDARRVLLSLILFVQIGLCGVRFPLLLGGVILLQQIFSKKMRLTDGIVLARLCTIALMPLAGYLLFKAGALDRLLDLGVGADESSLSRVESWRMLELLNGSVFWTGIPYDELELLLDVAKLPIIENSIAMYALSSGVITTMCVVAYLVAFVWARLPRTFAFGLVMVGALSGTIVFSVKGQFVPIFTVLCVDAYVATSQRHKLGKSSRATHYPYSSVG